MLAAWQSAHARADLAHQNCNSKATPHGKLQYPNVDDQCGVVGHTINQMLANGPEHDLSFAFPGVAAMLRKLAPERS